MIDRDTELDELARLTSPGAVVTVTGTAGVGKTRLVLEFARRVRDRRENDGVWFCDLASIVDADAVASVIAGALGVTPHGHSSIAAAVVSGLRGRTGLVVLDNVDQVVGHVAAIARELLRSRTTTSMIVTTREPLHVPDEQLFTVEPLDPGAAADLFVARAAAASTTVDRARDAAAIDSICRSLDGLPLSIELAAARLRVMSVNELERGLHDHVARRVDQPADQRSTVLTSSIGWSSGLLSSEQRLLFDRVSVFVGGFTIDGARAVMAGTGGDVAHGLGELVAASLVIQRSSPSGVRFSVLETLRQYGDRGLAERGERARARSAHLDHMVEVTEAANAECMGPGWIDGRSRLAVDWNNIRAAINWAIDTKHVADVDRMLRNLAFMSRWALEPEPAEWAARAFQRGLATEVEPGAPGHLHVAFKRYLAGDHDGALAENLAALDADPDPSDRGWARLYAAVELLFLGRNAEAAALADQMIADAPPSPVEQAMQTSAHAVFKLYARQIRFEDALAEVDASERQAIETGSPVALGHVLYNRALCLFSRGDGEAASAALARALELARAHEIANLVGYVITASVYTPGAPGLRAALEAMDHWRRRRDLSNEFVVLEAVGVNLGELRRFEPAAVILGHLEPVDRSIVASDARRRAVIDEISLNRRSAAWLDRGARMPRGELIDYAEQAIHAAL